MRFVSDMSTENIRKSNSGKDSNNAPIDIAIPSNRVNAEDFNEELDFFDFLEAMTNEIDTMTSESK